MNFVPTDREILEFRDRLKRGIRQFNDIVSANIFPYFCNIGDTELISFLIDNIQHIIECALCIVDVPRLVSKRCLSIIISNRAKYYQTLLNQTNLLSYLVDFAQALSGESRITQNAYFSILGGLSFNSTKLLPCFSTREYLRVLIANLNINECYAFLALLLTNGNVNDILYEVKFMDLIVEEIAKKEPTLRAAQSLFVKGFDTPFASDMLHSLLHDNCFATIVQNSIDEPTPDAFDFLRYLSQIASQRNLWKQWKEVIAIIEARLPEFVDIMLNVKGFTRMSEAVTSLVIAVFNHTKNDSYEVDKVFIRLGTDFWVYKSNSFLHNSFLKLLQTYSHTKTLTKSIINKVQLFDNVYNALKNEGTELACYYGQVREIAEIINPYYKATSNSIHVPQQEWKRMMSSLSSSRKVIRKAYGGKIPWKVRYQQLKYDSIITIGILFFFSIAIIYIVIPVAK